MLTTKSKSRRNMTHQEGRAFHDVIWAALSVLSSIKVLLLTASALLAFARMSLQNLKILSSAGESSESLPFRSAKICSALAMSLSTSIVSSRITGNSSSSSSSNKGLAIGFLSAKGSSLG